MEKEKMNSKLLPTNKALSWWYGLGKKQRDIYRGESNIIATTRIEELYNQHKDKKNDK